MDAQASPEPLGFRSFLLPEAHEAVVRRQRLARLRAVMAADELPALVLFDSVNLRYACGARNMQLNTGRNPSRFVFVPLEGPVVLFEYAGCGHLAAGLDTVDEVRPAPALHPIYAGSVKAREHLARFVGEIRALLAAHAPGATRLGLERAPLDAGPALADSGLQVVDATMTVERAKAVKSPEEVELVRASVRCTEAAVAHLERELRPGRSEAAVWAELNRALIAGGGEYVETRLFNSGSHTNPWFQECSDKPIAAGELVCLDTDAIGAHGYFADFSRTFLAGEGKPSGHQRRLYGIAVEQLETNVGLLKPWLAFREFAERARQLPEEFLPNRYFLVAHGNGLAGEYPFIPYRCDWEATGQEGCFEPGMTISLESFVGHPDGGEGVKLEEQVLITETGVERLSTYGLDPRLAPT
jgi:Xaa-Pro aminopeptidase